MLKALIITSLIVIAADMFVVAISLMKISSIWSRIEEEEEKEKQLENIYKLEPRVASKEEMKEFWEGK